MGKWQSAAFATVLPLQLDQPLATMMFCGALERHPGLTLVLAESGVGWLPYFLARADLEWHSLHDEIDDFTEIPPSELFHRQVMATFEEDAPAPTSSRSSVPTRACGRLTTRTPTARSPTRDRRSRRPSGALCDDDRRKLTVTNCAGAVRPGARVVSRAATDTICGLDHVALPMQDADAMAAFYRVARLRRRRNPHLVWSTPVTR